MAKWWWALVSFGFRLLYNEMAFTYDWVSRIVSLGQWRCWGKTALRYLHRDDDPVLDLAHGTGNLHLDLFSAGYTTFGLDASPYMGRITRRKFARKGLPVRITRGVGQRLPFADATFSAVVCTFPTPFILEQATLTEIYRVLKPGGRLVVVMSGIFTGKSPSVSLLEKLYEITGQRGENETGVLDVFRHVGFHADLVHEVCPSSVVILILGEKKT